MSIYLGNLSIKEMEARTGVTFPADLVEEMEKTHQSEASNIKPGHWHCFDIPFMLVCGDRPTAEKIYGHLAPLAGGFAQQMQIGLQS